MQSRNIYFVKSVTIYRMSLRLQDSCLLVRTGAVGEGMSCVFVRIPVWSSAGRGGVELWQAHSERHTEIRQCVLMESDLNCEFPNTPGRCSHKRSKPKCLQQIPLIKWLDVWDWILLCILNKEFYFCYLYRMKPNNGISFANGDQGLCRISYSQHRFSLFMIKFLKP